MYRLISFVIIIAVVITVAGCGGSTNERKDQQPVLKVDKSAEPAVQTTPPKMTTEVKETPAVAITAQPAKPKGEWTLVFNSQGNIEKTDKENCLKAIRETWFKDKPFDEVTSEEFNKDMARFVGQKVIFAEIIYQYGEYEMTVRTGKIEKEGNEFLEKPIDEGKNDHIRGQSNMDDLIKEIRFMK
jgi:hypothetical protein